MFNFEKLSFSQVCNLETKFVDIMKCYRQQPQSQSDTYRHVLMKAEEELPDGSKYNLYALLLSLHRIS